MFAAIETRFGGNEDIKKTQKTLLKQPYENFSASSTESLDSIFKRLQKIISRLVILGVVITQEDLNSKFLTSLPPEWNSHVVVWINKAEIETMSIDDLYNNFKIVEQSVKKSVGASSGAQNLAFMTAPSTNSTNDVNTAKPAYEVSTVSLNFNTASPQVSTVSFTDNVVYAFMVENPNGSNILQQDLEKIHEDDLETMDFKWQLSLLSRRAKRYYQRTGKKIFINANDTARYDKSKVECFNCHKDGILARGVLFAEEQVQTNMALMAFSNSKNEVLFSEEVSVLKREVACKDHEINVLKSKFEKVKQEKEGIEFKIEKFDKASKDLDKLLGSQITDKSKKGLGYTVVPLSHPLIYNRPKKLDLSYSGLDEFKEPEFKGYGSENKHVSKDTSSFVESSLNVDKETIFPIDKKVEFVKPKNPEKLVKKLVRYAEMYRSQTPRGNQRNWKGQKSNQLRSDFVMYNKACFICGSFNHVHAQCKYHQREMMVYGNNYNRVNYNYTTKRTHPNAQRNMVPRVVLMKTGLKPFNTARTVNTAHPKSTVFSAKPMSRFSKIAQSTAQAVNTARPQAVNTARPKAVKTARPNSVVVNVPQQDDTGFVDNRCSRHMTGNIGYVTFGGGAHGGRISSKGTLKTDSLDFEDVYFVNELKFNLFSVSQMCDKKNYVLFTDTECLVLSPNFKLPDENQILLKIPRKDNMYSFDMKNIVPKESLTCLVAKATLDESMLWHRRLGHINFKNINKLVKDNLVRGLPTKHFENDQTCVACLKGKQHRASCKSKVLNPITKPLFMLHMDLFGPTFVSSLMHKKYCLVVTDDYSRFTWVFFLTTKDETSEILKNFIKEIENLVDKKVKIIRSDNGTEFKNKVMDDFCREKGTISNESAGTQEEFIVGTYTQKEEISQDYIVMPIWKDASYFDSPSKDVGNVEPKSAADDQNPEVTTGRFKLNTVDPSVNTASLSDPNSRKDMFTMGANHTLEATHVEFFSDEDEPEVDLGNILNSYTVPTTPNIRIHKDHPIKNVIGDVKSSIQTRRMTKPTSEQGFLSAVYEQKTHDTLNTCLYACFLSQIEPTSIAKALSDSSWVEAMQEELLQFKLQQVVKALYGCIKQPRAMVMETLARLSIRSMFSMGIIFSSTNKGTVCTDFVDAYEGYLCNICARFQVTPQRTSYLFGWLKRNFRYLKATQELGKVLKLDVKSGSFWDKLVEYHGKLRSSYKKGFDAGSFKYLVSISY
ncbi:putative ribonuclease H-like domain-containing protein [Tanacetum coccineum]